MALKYTTQYLVDFIKEHGDNDLQTKWLEQESDFKKGFKKSEKKSENKKIKGAPKKNKTAYNIFCSEERLKVKNDNPDLSNKEIFSEMAVRWNALKDSDPDRYEYFQKLAEQDKQRYQTEKDNFVPTEETVEGSKKKSKKEKSDGPKKAKTAYMFFCEHERKIVIKEKPELGAKDILVELGARWKNLKENDSKKIKSYEAMAEKDKKRFQNEKALLEKSKNENTVEESVSDVQEDEPVKKVEKKDKPTEKKDKPKTEKKGAKTQKK